MKKITLLLLVGFTYISGINAQLLNEDFSGASFPPSGWSIDNHDANWSQETTNHAGGVAPEARFSWEPQFNGDSRFISPTIDLTGVNAVTLRFKHNINHYDGAYTVGVATRSGNGAWTSVWSMQGGNTTEDKTLIISNSDTGQSDFQFCFYFSGNSFNINYWYIDDVELLATPSLDLAVQSIEVPSYVEAGQSLPIAVKLFNMGMNDITSFDISYTVDGNTISENANVTIQSGSALTYNFATDWTTVTGNHQIEVNISNINGGNDDVTSNNTLTKDITGASQIVSNFPLFEEFTSSTCSPCANFNSSVMGPFLTNHENEFALIKYQMNWPGSGDSYYTQEGGSRRAYYSVTGVPNLFVGGEKISSTNTAVNNAYNNENAENAYMDMTGEFTMQGSVINTSVTITPYISGNFVAHVVVIEKETINNASSNGETSFDHVMMKMLPDANGTNVALVDGTPTTLSFTYDMASTNVEELSDLAVVAFIQNDSDKNVMQSVYVPNDSASVDEFIFKNIKVYPNPTYGKIYIEAQETVNYSVLDMGGRTIKPEKNLSNSNEVLDLNNLPSGIYLLKLSNDKHTELRKIIKK